MGKPFIQLKVVCLRVRVKMPVLSIAYVIGQKNL